MFISYRDNVIWDEEQEKSAQSIAEKQLKARLPQEKLGKFEMQYTTGEISSVNSREAVES